MKSSITDTPKEINSSDQKITRSELRNVINKASAHKDTLVKLYKEKEAEYLVVFAWQDRNKWKIDYPIQLHKIHKQRYVSHKQCLELSEYIYNGNSLDDFKGFIDVPIRHFNLDEMIHFKKEDEMMLHGEDPDLLIPAPTPSKEPEIQEVQKNNQTKQKNTKPSRILGDIPVPKIGSRTKSTPSVATKKKSKPSSPLKQFKTSAAQLKKEKEQPKAAKPSIPSTSTKKETLSAPSSRTTDDNSILDLEAPILSKREKRTKISNTSETSEEKTVPTQKITQKTTEKTNPEISKKKSPAKSKNKGRKTLHQLGAPLAEKKKVTPKKPTPFTGTKNQKDTSKPSDDNSFFSI